MYFSSQNACSEPSSTTPMPQSAIDRQNQWRAAMELYFSRGNQTMNDLVSRLGGNPTAGVGPGPGDAGVPTAGVPFLSGNGMPIVIPWGPYGGPTAPATPPSAWNPSSFLPDIRFMGGKWKLGGNGANSPPAHCPQVLPLVTVLPTPVLLTPQPAPQAPSPVAAVPVPTPVAAAPARRPDPPECDLSKIGVCAAIRDGCFLGDQFSLQQRYACSARGYAGNKDLFPWLLAQGGALGGQYFGTPDPNPVPAKGPNDPGVPTGIPTAVPRPPQVNLLTWHPNPLPPAPSGVSGIFADEPGSGVFWGSLAAAAFALYAGSQLLKPKRKRR